MKKFTFKEIFIIFLLGIVSFIYIIKNQDFVLLKITLLLIGMKGVDFDRCISFDMKIRILFMGLMFVLFSIHIAPDVTSYYEGAFRHSLGFTNPNTLGLHVLLLSFDILYVNRNKLSFGKVLFLVIFLFVMDSYSGSRTTLMTFLLAIILILLYKWKPSLLENSFCKFVIINSPILFSLLVWGAYLLYVNQTAIGIEINSILSNRLYNIYFFSQRYGLSLFGFNLSSANLTLDTTVAYCLYAGGLVGLSLFLVSFKHLLQKLYKTRRYLLIILFFSFMVYSVSEKLWMNIDYNIFIAVFALFLYEKQPVIVDREAAG